jgi:hypothetical protein
MNELMRSYCAIGAGVVIAYALSFPLQAGFNSLAVKICQHNPNRGLVTYKDNIFVGQTRVACIPKKYI